VTAVREELGRRLQRWRNTALPIAQTALAASLAWLVASHVADHQSRFFAPIAAVICLGVTLGQRVRRGLEMVAGVGIGVGTGPWQIELLVVLATVLYLASDDASNVTGTEIVVDGGTTGAPHGAPIYRSA
jgi:NAD(P)-dependent dehydrogenase (short-subunit alcohol dehydrogenase family)